MTADINHVVHAPHDPEVAVLIATRAVAREVGSLYLGPVLAAVTLVVAPDGPQHRGPRALDNQIAALALAHGAAVARHHVHLYAGQRLRRGARLRRRRPRHGRDHHGPGLGLPPRIHNRAARLAYDLPVPHPRLRVNRLADCA